MCFARCCGNCRSTCQLGVTCGDDDDDCGGSGGGGGGACDDCVQDGALAIASRISCDSCPHTIIPKSSDGCWGSSTPAADIVAAVPDSIFTTRGPEQVVSHRDFTLTLLHVFVVRHIV